MKKLFFFIAIIAIAINTIAQDSIKVTPGKSVVITTIPCNQVTQQQPLPTNKTPKKHRQYSGGISDQRPFLNPSKITVAEVGMLANIFADYQQRTGNTSNFFQQISMEQNYGTARIYPEGMVVYYGKVPNDARNPLLVPTASNDGATRDGLLILGIVLILGLLAYLIHQSRPHAHPPVPPAPAPAPAPVRVTPTVPSHESLKPGDTLEVNENGGYKYTRGSTATDKKDTN